MKLALIAPRTGTAAPSAGRESDRIVRRGVIIVVGFFGFLGGWASLSPLDSAAVTYGVVATEGSRKAVQHLDGGIVKAVLAKEGDLVSEGDVLIQLDQVGPRASLEIQSAGVATLSALIARLEAEASKASEITFPGDLVARREEPKVAELMGSQLQIFAARTKALRAQAETIDTQISQAKSQITIYRGQANTALMQERMIKEELAPKQLLYDKGFGTNSPLMQLKRAATALAGQRQEYEGQIQRLEHSMAQLNSQIAQIESDQLLKVAQELEDARMKLADAKERQRVATDILERTAIRAPARGHVLGLTVNTVGGVIGKGERLAEIVPDTASLVVKGRLSASEGVDIAPGMKAQVRILSAEGRTAAPVNATVRKRSADARTDPATGALYYEVEAAVVAEEADLARQLKLEPGTPAEIIIPTGARTVLTYLIEPVTNSLRHGLREK